MSCQSVEEFRIALGPGVVDGHTPEAPFLAVAHELAIIAVHQERVLRSAARTFPWPEMLRHDIRIQGGRIVTDFDLEIAGGVAGVERAEKWNQRIHDSLTAVQLREVDPELPARGPEIENAIFRKDRRQRIGIAVVETKSVSMQRVSNLVAVGGLLRQIRAAHARQFRRLTSWW